MEPPANVVAHAPAFPYAPYPFDKDSPGDVYLQALDDDSLHKTLLSEIGPLLNSAGALDDETVDLRSQDNIPIRRVRHSLTTVSGLLCIFRRIPLPIFLSPEALFDFIRACDAYNLDIWMYIVGRTQFTTFAKSNPAECFDFADSIKWELGATISGALLRLIPPETLQNDPTCILMQPGHEQARLAYENYRQRCVQAGRAVIVLEGTGTVRICGRVVTDELEGALCDHHAIYGAWVDVDMGALGRHSRAPPSLTQPFLELRERITALPATTPNLQSVMRSTLFYAIFTCGTPHASAAVYAFILSVTKQVIGLIESAIKQVPVFDNAA
ncbi:hypothetical protein PsYK624_149960 [Phanerochaete sordida]|uniref:Uncharacterized protein n=1 Tax=Phanerochaete sordida TaxID=48140 RepID=A0A9P3GSM5_9APHY|nr:hypothetical protein PsYK624_149960 [Phanerochaete sordida]